MDFWGDEYSSAEPASAAVYLAGGAGFQVHLDSWSRRGAGTHSCTCFSSTCWAAAPTQLSRPEPCLAWHPGGTPTSASHPPRQLLHSAPSLRKVSPPSRSSRTTGTGRGCAGGETKAQTPVRAPSSASMADELSREGDPRHVGPHFSQGGQAELRLIPLASWSQSRPPAELLLGKFHSRAALY